MLAAALLQRLSEHDVSGNFIAMSRQRGASSMHRTEQVAQDLIARRIPARAGELLEIIHAINPTGRSLGAADERRCYELKARLQSLLRPAAARDHRERGPAHGSGSAPGQLSK